MHARTPLNRRLHYGYLLAIVWLACAWLPLYAATPASAASAGDPPVEVARVAYLAGDVSLLPAGASQWQNVDLNRPLTTGDELATGADARVELQLAGAVAHLAGDTDFSLLALGEWQTQLALRQGTAELDVATLPDGEYVEIDTPQVAVVIDRSARVRVDTGSGGASTVTVRRGTVVVHGDHGEQQVLQAGERYRFPSPQLADAVALTYGSGDAFDRWAQSREMLYADAQGGQYIAPGMVGYQDLDQYGQWSSEPDYGEVWFPDDVVADWVPYRNGRWDWIAPWGMTWVSNEPWGFAPFHYGRWARIGGRWGWLPGAVSVRAVYAPALVGFFGGSGWNVSVGLSMGVGPLVGWYPLGPGMIYNPWYAAGWGYYWRVNRRDYRHRYRDHESHVHAAYNAWRKPRLLRHMRFLGQPPHGITIVSRKSLQRGHDFRRVRLHVDAGQLGKAPVRSRGLDLAPRPVRTASWHPGRAAYAKSMPVVALHRPPPMSVGAMRHAHAAPTVRRRAPVRLLTADARTWERPAHRPLPSRMFNDPPPRRVAPASKRVARDTGANVAGLPSTRVAPVIRGRNPKRDATLPRVPRLELRTGSGVQRHTGLPTPRMYEAGRPAQPVRRVEASPKPVRRADRIERSVRPADTFRPIKRRVDTVRPVERRERQPRPTMQPRRMFEQRDSAPTWHAPAPRSLPSPVRRAAPVRWHPARAMPEQHAEPFHISSSPAQPRHATSGKRSGKRDVRSHRSH